MERLHESVLFREPAQQGALSFELRAAVTAVRLAGRRRGPARLATSERLAATYARFTEGLDTADLREARKLLGDRSPT